MKQLTLAQCVVTLSAVELALQADPTNEQLQRAATKLREGLEAARRRERRRGEEFRKRVAGVDP